MLELALAARNFSLNPCDLFGVDIPKADPAFVSEFVIVCGLRLMLWDAYIEKRKAEAMKDAQSGVPDQQPPLVIPEYQN